MGAGWRSYYQCSKGWKVQADPVEGAWHAECARASRTRDLLARALLLISEFASHCLTAGTTSRSARLQARR